MNIPVQTNALFATSKIILAGKIASFIIGVTAVVLVVGGGLGFSTYFLASQS
jgi:hypothetical protein